MLDGTCVYIHRYIGTSVCPQEMKIIRLRLLFLRLLELLCTLFCFHFCKETYFLPIAFYCYPIEETIVDCCLKGLLPAAFQGTSTILLPFWHYATA